MTDHPPLSSIEREFGVPFPGRIVPQKEWTQTALKEMPPGHLDFKSLFGRDAPVVLDLGCGNGRSTIHHAMIRPECDFLGIDPLPVVIRYARKRGNQRGMTNVKFAVLGGLELVRDHVAPGIVAGVFVYHPQPYYDPATVHRRLVTPEFLYRVHRCLVPGGEFVIQTDNPGYWKYIREVVPFFFEFHERIGRWPDAPKGRTRREILAMKRGLPVFRGHGTALRTISPDDVARLADTLPPPTFDADRRLRQLDQLE
jgi:tRNA (guanine-N7-)-methyltransferase